MSYNPLYHEEDFEIPYSSRDINDHILPQFVFQKFQDLAGTNADELGVGYQELKAKDLIWVVVKERYKVLRPAPLGKLKIYTWPHKKKVLEYNREYKAVDNEGNPLIIGTSQWCICNIKTRKLTLGKIDYKEGEYHEENNFPDGYKLLTPKDVTGITPNLVHKVVFTELDHNRHMNNTFYASLIVDSIDGMCDYMVLDMQMNFLKECTLGDVISVYAFKSETKEDASDVEYQVIGIRQDGVLSFNSYLKLKHI